MGVYGKSHLGVSFCYVGLCVLREWVVKGGGLDGYFGEQGLPVGIQGCLERFHRGRVDCLSQQCVQNGTARIVNADWRRRAQHAYRHGTGRTGRRGRVALCGLDVRRWTP